MTTFRHRGLARQVWQDLQKKMVLLCGPRQSGKTMLAKELCRKAGSDLKQWYLNWDSQAHRERIMAETFPEGKGLLVLDEVHKYRRWRQTVKGLFDTRGNDVKILVTGSARLDHYRRGGDSLQGRYHFLRLLPFSAAELGTPGKDCIRDLMRFGPFPEPFLSGSETEARRWSREYRSLVIREDLRDLERVVDIDIIDRLAIRLPQLVGAPLSINALREDLQVAHHSVARWITMLENMYVLFRVYPFGSPQIRAVKKEAKQYHFDWTTVPDEGARFENLIGFHLLKWCWHRQDCDGFDTELRYFRDTDKREVDFVIVENGRPVRCVECKVSRRDINPALNYFKRRFPSVDAVQVCLEEGPDVRTKENIRVVSAGDFTAGLV
jgi:uncharacterized protein